MPLDNLSPVYVFDLNGTLAKVDHGEDEFMASHPSIQKAWAQNKPFALDAVANAYRPLSNHIPGQTIGVEVYESTLPFLSGKEVWIYSSASRRMIRNALDCSIDDHVAGFISTFDYNDELKKRTDSFVNIYQDFKRDGKQLISYFDDGGHNVMSALFASMILKDKIGESFRVYLVLGDEAAECGIGEAKYGFYVIGTFDDVEKIEEAEKDGRPLRSSYKSEVTESRWKGAGLDDKVEEEWEHMEDGEGEGGEEGEAEAD